VLQELETVLFDILEELATPEADDSPDSVHGSVSDHPSFNFSLVTK